MSDIIIIQDFFNNFSFIKEEFKKIKLYNQKEFNEKFNESQTWPGQRSENLLSSHPILVSLFIETCRKNDFFKKNKVQFCSMYTHLRLGNDNDSDWIHQDVFEYSMIVYLSDTSLTSGTNFYLKKDEASLTHKATAVQNTAVIFKGNIFHKSASNFGDSIENGRLTLNIFFNF